MYAPSEIRMNFNHFQEPFHSKEFIDVREQSNMNRLEFSSELSTSVNIYLQTK